MLISFNSMMGRGTNDLDDVPQGARPVARILLIDPHARILLLRAVDPSNGQTWWVTPGGGLEAGESFEDAAMRELREETGLQPPIGPWVWTRRRLRNLNRVTDVRLKPDTTYCNRRIVPT